jgi:galactonate dehydratase
MPRCDALRIEAARVWVVPTGWRRAVILELTASDGTTGIGEAGTAYGTGTGSAAQMVCDMLDRHVMGRSADSLNAIWHDIYDRGFWVRNGGAIAHAGLSAIEQALWDMRGKRLGAPVFDLMGGRLRDSLDVYANGWWAGCDSPDDYARAGKETVARGYVGLKFYPLGLADPMTVVRHPQLRQVEARTLTLACDRVAALREAVGPDVEIMLDFGGGLSTDQALRVLRRMEPFDVLFVEEPVDPSAPSAMREGRGRHYDPAGRGRAVLRPQRLSPCHRRRRRRHPAT